MSTQITIFSKVPEKKNVTNFGLDIPPILERRKHFRLLYCRALFVWVRNYSIAQYNFNPIIYDFKQNRVCFNFITKRCQSVQSLEIVKNHIRETKILCEWCRIAWYWHTLIKGCSVNCKNLKYWSNFSLDVCEIILWVQYFAKIPQARDADERRITTWIKLQCKAEVHKFHKHCCLIVRPVRLIILKLHKFIYVIGNYISAFRMVYQCYSK